MAVPYMLGADLPDLAITWTDHTGQIIDFATGWTFTVKVGTPGEPAVFTKTSGITGATIAPNLVIGWSATDELNILEPNKTYTVSITAVRTADSKERKMATSIFIRDDVEDEAS